MRRLLVLVVITVLAGCGGPLLIFPGGALTGEEVAFRDTDVPAQTTTIQLETRPSDPYSINTTAVVVAGGLYIDPAEDRRWYQHLAANPLVRLTIDGEQPVYAARVVAVTDAELLEQFETGRIILQIVPRLADSARHAGEASVP